MFRTQVNFVFDFDGSPAQTVTWGGENQLKATANANAGIATGAYTSPGVVSVGSIVELGQFHVIMDKQLLTGLLAPGDGNSDFVMSSTNAVQQAIQNMKDIGLGVDESPRTKWNRATPGPVHRKPADFSGAAGLIEFLNNLPAFAEILKREGRVRDAGIVLFAYRQTIAGKMSITEMLQYLRDNRIV